MIAMPCRFLAASLRPTPVEMPPADPEDQWFSNTRQLLNKLHSFDFARYLMAFFIGIGAAMVWQSCIGPAERAITTAAAPPDQQQLNAILLDTMRQSIDRMAANVAAVEEHIKRGVDALGAGQEQLGSNQDEIMREIDKLEISRSGNAEPSSRPVPVPAPTPVKRSTETDTRSDWRRQPCCQWPVSSSR